MNKDDLTVLFKMPDTVTPQNIHDIKEMIEYYPYFAFPRILLAKVANDSGDIHAKKYLKQSVLYASDKRQLYYFLHPEKKLSNEPLNFERTPRYSGNYFDLIDAVEAEGGDPEKSLKNLAERLKSARTLLKNTDKKETSEPDKDKNEIAPKSVRIPTPDYFSALNDKKEEFYEISEDNVKKLIKEKKYERAIEILRKLILTNPKKSIYFADQIRFLEKILVNTQK
ncbi:MAG: hypothetical protein PHH37_12940 [Paludibacter sp.]|nr:hypothetical protein [Paludibacter sp.]